MTMVMTQAAGAKRVEERVTLAALFVGFLKVSLLGFGGGLVWARRIVVDQQRWLDDQEFAEILTLCQLMPGPNIVGITLCVGTKLRGAIGAITAVAGFIVIPWTVGLALGGLGMRYAHLGPRISSAVAAAAGLMIATGVSSCCRISQIAGFHRHGID
jgi:chromate transporter